MKSEALQPALGYRFTRPELLVQALTHRSYGAPHNERLEFLGDSLLNCSIAALLFDTFPQLREGDLSRLRASLVRQETLAEVALGLQLGDFLRLGEGELKSGGFRRPSILADALEAIFGAIYLDSNFDGVAGVITALFRPLLERVDPSDAGKDAKTALQEFLQARHLPLPRYLLRTTRGEAHAQEFEVECGIPELGITSQGSGPSRRGAEQAAARSALEMAKSK